MIMENKLELKHLAGYLPYKLRVTTTFGERNFKNTFELVIDFQPNNLDVISIEAIMTHYGEGHKPILRPLSDLTERHAEAWGIRNLGKLIKNIQDKEIPLIVAEELYEEHFDIHGLIDAGLAVDINTLKPNDNEKQ